MLSIGSFSKFCSVSPKTLRYYDELGLLKPAYVDKETGYRYYHEKQLKDLLLIVKLKEYQFSLDEIIKLVNNSELVDNFVDLLYEKQRDIEMMLVNYSYILKRLEKDIQNIERGVDIMSYLDDIEVKVVEREAIPVISVREMVDFTNQKGFSNALTKCFLLIKENNLTPIGAPIAIYHGEEFIETSYDTEIAIPIKEIDKKTNTIEVSKCAMVTLKGPYSELSSAYAKLREWISEKGYNLAGPPYDIYVTDPTDTKPEDCITEIYFPIK